MNSQKQGAWTLGPSISAHEPGVLYFTSEHENGRGRADIYRIEYQMRGQADASQHYQDWLEFKKELAVEAGGPQGFYAIQDMRELHPGESAYLSSGDVDKLRWTQAAPATDPRAGAVQDGRALIRGPGIEERDLLQSKGEPLALPSGLTVRGSLLREKALKLWLYNAKLPQRKGFEALDYFPYDARGVIIRHSSGATSSRCPVNYLDSREQAGIMYWSATLQAQIGGKTYDLKTYSYSNDWKEIEVVLLLLRDRTSGKTHLRWRTRGERRGPEGIAAAAHVRPEHRVQLPVRALRRFQLPAGAAPTTLDMELKYGEKYPPLFSGHSAER